MKLASGFYMGMRKGKGWRFAPNILAYETERMELPFTKLEA